jgi:hypothetical protein
MIKVTRWLRVIALALVLGALAVAAFVAPSGLRAAGDNAVANGDFESGATGWTCKSCSLTTGAPAQAGSAAQLTTLKKSGRAQFMQNGITLQPNTTYEFSFWAQSNNGANLQVALLQQTSPYTNYGMTTQNFDVTTTGKEFTYTFTTTGFSQTVNNARLRFRADRGKGIQYSIDNISLAAVGDPPPPPSGGNEMLIYDWNKPITTAEGGFAMDKVSQYLGQNWTQPTNYADGRLYFRARIYSIPQNQPGMKLGFCFWQGERENCKGSDVAGVAGTVATWDVGLHQMWKKNSKEVDWSQPRKKMGFAVRDGQNDPVSDKTSADWGGNNPAHWYPMNLRFQVVLVPAGESFSGWQNYP